MLQTHSYGNVPMPLLMGFTPQTPIQTSDENEHFTYNDTMQITMYDMRTVGTKSLKITSTRKSTYWEHDKKNDIDDSKTVK